MITLTLLFFGAIVYYVISVPAPEKAPVTGFDVDGHNASAVRITSLAGSSLDARKVSLIIGSTRTNLTGLVDSNDNGFWDPGETAFMSPYDITNPTRVMISSNNYLLLDILVKYVGGALAGNATVPAYSPGLVATYYLDETWSTPAASAIATKVHYADNAGVAGGYASDEAGWPVALIGRDEQFSVRFEGLIRIDQEDNYTFYLTSDDGSFLHIDGAQVVDNGGLHSPRTRTGTVHLTAGYHDIAVRMFEHTGNAVIWLEHSSPSVPRTLVTALYHVPSGPPQADFTAIPTVANAPVTVQFRDESTEATAWAWDFGDGGTSSAQNPAHAYAANGVYTVRLTATNGLGSNTTTKSGYIQLGSAVLGFTARYFQDETWGTPVIVKSIGRVRFADNAGVGVGYASDEAGWPVPELGRDEQFSVRFEGMLRIDQEADYTFYLTSDDGSTLHIDGALVVDNGGLHSPSTRTGTVHLTAGYHAIDAKMFEHTGQAVIWLEYSSPTMARKFVDTVYHAPLALPVPAFSGSPTAGTAPTTVQFQDASIDTSAWAWDFGDGGTSSAQNPAHAYTANGNYTVRLTATNSLGSNTLTKASYIVIGTMAQGVRATYYTDETWGTAAGSEVLTEIRLADAAGIAVGHGSDRANWPVYAIGKDDYFSVRFTGSLQIGPEADYTFYLTSDDGSYLYVDGALVVDNSGLHSARTRAGTVHLTAGYHAIEVKMFEHDGEAVVQLEYSSPTMARKFVQEVYTM